ncbi:MAG: HAMP domain-containing histidine kinase [Deltaproteobacteria bacterium]|nr:HAMP domain-containing histidine kinase [Deltaproteobacteria bacterium]
MNDNTASSKASNNVDMPSLILLAGLDLRSNLSNVIAYSEILLKEKVGTLNEQQKTFVQSIQKSGQRLARFENMLTTLARIETKTSIEIETVDILECIQEGIKRLSQHIEAKGQETIVEFTDKSPLVSANAYYLEKSIFFIVSNAHQYSPKDSRIRINTEVVNNEVKVTISDTGIGISLDDQERIFDVAFRVNHPVVMKHNGLGTNLYFAKYYIEYFGGNIGIESIVDEGSKFWFTIPIAATEKI